MKPTSLTTYTTTAVVATDAIIMTAAGGGMAELAVMLPDEPIRT